MVRIVQLLCPQRHCIIGAAYEDDKTNADETVLLLRTIMNSGVINPWCGICASRELTFEDAATNFRNMEQAKPNIEHLQAQNILAKNLLGKH
jgi:hypothetical protein